MKKIKMLQQTRQVILNLADGLSEDQLLFIPSGFRNNILWNMGHITVSQQILHYKLSGLELNVSGELITSCGKGTSPEEWDTPPDSTAILQLLADQPKRLAEDYRKDAFSEFQPYQTATGPMLNDIDDAITFCIFHEGFHAGVISSLKKLAN